ncbi:MAG: hypothetical protein Q9167_000628 [Letrouitia subvulpina]
MPCTRKIWILACGHEVVESISCSLCGDLAHTHFTTVMPTPNPPPPCAECEPIEISYSEEQMEVLERRLGLRTSSESAPSNPPPAAPGATFASSLAEALEKAIAGAAAAAAAAIAATTSGAATSAQNRTPRYVPSFEEQRAQRTDSAAQTAVNGWSLPWSKRAYTIHEPAAANEASRISPQMRVIELHDKEEDDDR